MSETRMVEWKSIATASEAARQVARNQTVVVRHCRAGNITFPDGEPAWYKDEDGTVYVHLPSAKSYYAALAHEAK